YLKIRDRYPNSILLESSEYHGNNNSFSYICFNPIASITVENQTIEEQYPDQTKTVDKIDQKTNVPERITAFAKRFETDNNDFKFINNGHFGYIAYDAVQYFEDITISKKEDSLEIPDIYYAIYQDIIAINHF